MGIVFLRTTCHSSGFSSLSQELDEHQPLNEEHLQRQMSDQLTRLQQVSPMHSRLALMQRLMSKIAVLSDKDFERAFDTLESLVEKYNKETADIKNDKNKSKSISMPSQDLLKKDILAEIKDRINIGKNL